MSAGEVAASTVRSEWGLVCPRCGSDKHLEVEISTMATLSPKGTTEIGDQLWDHGSYMRCEACEFDGHVKDFEAAEES